MSSALGRHEIPGGEPGAWQAEAEDLIACPQCDVLHQRVTVPTGQRARCRRCRTVLMAPRGYAYVRSVALSLTVVILMISAIFSPFLTISAAGNSRSTSVYEVPLAFAHGVLLPLAFVVLAMVVLFPVLRASALIYAIWPLAQGRKGFAHAAGALRLAYKLQPWSMAEIFVFGTSVALVKVAGLATVELGPAFWSFCGLVLLITVNDNSLCKWTLWQALEDQTNS